MRIHADPDPQPCTKGSHTHMKSNDWKMFSRISGFSDNQIFRRISSLPYPVSGWIGTGYKKRPDYPAEYTVHSYLDDTVYWM